MAQLVSEYGNPINAAATVSGTTTSVTRTLTCPTGARIRLRTIVIYASASSNVTLTVTVGSTVVVDFGTLALTTSATVIAINLAGSVGDNIVINAGAGSAGTTTITHVAAYF